MGFPILVRLFILNRGPGSHKVLQHQHQKAYKRSKKLIIGPLQKWLDIPKAQFWNTFNILFPKHFNYDLTALWRNETLYPQTPIYNNLERRRTIYSYVYLIIYIIFLSITNYISKSV